MTITQIVSALSRIAENHGWDTPIQGWLIADPTALASLDSLAVSKVSTGTRRGTPPRPIAVIHLEAP